MRVEIEHRLSDKAWEELGFGENPPEDAKINYKDFAEIVVSPAALADYVDEGWIERTFNDDKYKKDLNKALRTWVVNGQSPGAIRMNNYMWGIFESAVSAVMYAGEFGDLDEGYREPITEIGYGVMRFYRADGSSVPAYYRFDSEVLSIEVVENAIE